MVDPSVSVMVSRDLDSRLTGREAAAVTQWLADPQQLPFHVMRDNPQHGAVIPAGMWGARMNNGYRNELARSLNNLLKDVCLGSKGFIELSYSNFRQISMNGSKA